MSYGQITFLGGILLLWVIPTTIAILVNYLLPRRERYDYIGLLVPLFNIDFLFRIVADLNTLLQKRKRIQKLQVQEAFERIK